MAQVSSQHVAPLTAGFIGLLLFGVAGLAVLNYLSDK